MRWRALSAVTGEGSSSSSSSSSELIAPLRELSGGVGGLPLQLFFRGILSVRSIPPVVSTFQQRLHLSTQLRANFFAILST